MSGGKTGRPRYTKYREPGSEWYGQIPEHWDVKRMRYFATVNPSAAEARPLAPDTDVSFVPMEAVGADGTLDLSRVKSLASVSTGHTYFREGDIVIAKITPCFENGKGARARGLASGIAFGTTELHVLRASEFVDGHFLYYVTLCDAFRRLGEAQMYGAGGQKRVPSSFVENFEHPMPPLDEQRTIAAFLDRETVRIDSLVAKNERLIELLQERRAALLTHAITTGASPQNALFRRRSHLKQRVPTGWEMRKLRHIIKRVVRPIIVDPDIEYREIGIRSWGKGLFHKDPVRGALLEEKRVFSIQPGDFVLNIVFAWEGAVGVASSHERGMVASHRFPTFRCADDVDLDYLLMVLQSDHGRAVMQVNSPGAAGRNRTIRLSQFLDEQIPIPPFAEQRVIVTRFRSEEGRIYALIAKVRDALERLRELRTALISAAVTGKIDVREEAGS